MPSAYFFPSRFLCWDLALSRLIYCANLPVYIEVQDGLLATVTEGCEIVIFWSGFKSLGVYAAFLAFSKAV